MSYWKRLLKVPWTARRSNQSILREMNPEYTLEYHVQQFIGRTDAETEVPVFWSSDVSSQLIGKVPDTRKDWGQKEKRTLVDKMAGWQHQCNGHEFGQTSGNGEGQGGLACCSPWGRQEVDTTGQLNNNNRYSIPILFTRKLSFHGLSYNYKSFQGTTLTCTLRLPWACVLCHSVMVNSLQPHGL